VDWHARLAADAPDLYVNREASWLDFNDRVLAEADDQRNLLLERVRFLAIASSNMDEFYAKRVAWLKQLLRTNPMRRTVDGLTVSEQYDAVVARCAATRRDMERCWRAVLEPALRAHGISIVPYLEVDAQARAGLDEYFMTSVYPVLTPLVVDPAHPFPFISYRARGSRKPLPISSVRGATDGPACTTSPPATPNATCAGHSGEGPGHTLRPERPEDTRRYRRGRPTHLRRAAQRGG